MFSRTLNGVMAALVYNRTDSYFAVLLKAVMTFYEGPVYVYVRFNQVGLKDCIIFKLCV